MEPSAKLWLNDNKKDPEPTGQGKQYKYQISKGLTPFAMCFTISDVRRTDCV